MDVNVPDRVSCSTAQRTAKNLKFASEVLRREGLCKEIFVANGQLSCELLKVRWKEWTSSQSGGNSSRRFKYASAIKGTKTLFDEPCYGCDRKEGDKVQESWAARALESPQETDAQILEDVKSRTRWYMGTRWWNEDRQMKGRARVPDQQGCAELERGFGGTMSVPRWYEKPVQVPTRDDTVRYVKEDYSVTKCRLGVAKQKGKMRVVTMQASRAKRILQPVHKAAYRHLSRQPWLVVGDVTKENMESVKADIRPGEKFRSGDFEASTDNLNKDAVVAVVEVLGESLPERRRKVLLDTFKNSWVEWKKEKKLIVRGSMMGNSLSFVVLCLLNKICLDRARQQVENCGPNYRRSLVNGDDLFFAGSDKVFEAWLKETSRVGFVINRAKTMSSERYGDLNSSTYDFSRGRFVAKLCFGWLATNDWKEPNGTVADNAFSLANCISFPTAAWLLTHPVVQQVFRRVFPPISLIPRRWWSFLIRKRWFRVSMQLPDRQPDTVGTNRSLPMVYGYPLIDSNPTIERSIKRISRRYIREFVTGWRGVIVRPEEIKVRKTKRQKTNENFSLRISRGEKVWKRLWLEPVYEIISEQCPWLLDTSKNTWISDQPDIKPVQSYSLSFPFSSDFSRFFAPFYSGCPLPDGGISISSRYKRWSSDDMRH